MNNHFKLISYAQKCISAFADVLDSELEIIPSVVAVVHDTDYCGMMNIYGTDVMTKAVMVLHLDNITLLAEHDNIDIEQAVLETIYHEWIHYIHAVCHFDDYGLMMCHEGKLWDSMLEIGLDNGFIHRRAI